MNQNQISSNIPANIMMSNMMNNNSPSISSMGGGTPISQLRKDVVTAKTQKIKSDMLDTYADDYTTDSDRKSHIKNLVEDINNEIEDGKKNKEKKQDTDTETEEEKPKKKKSKGSFFNFSIPEMIKDPILIWILYMLMSQNFFKKLIGKYLTQINPNEEGVVSITGVAVYGLVMVVLFTLIKFLLKQLKKY
jgi:hypothetical protein